MSVYEIDLHQASRGSNGNVTLVNLAESRLNSLLERHEILTRLVVKIRNEGGIQSVSMPAGWVQATSTAGHGQFKLGTEKVFIPANAPNVKMSLYFRPITDDKKSAIQTVLRSSKDALEAQELNELEDILGLHNGINNMSVSVEPLNGKYVLHVRQHKPDPFYNYHLLVYEAIIADCFDPQTGQARIVSMSLQSPEEKASQYAKHFLDTIRSIQWKTLI